jgi:hypothetical protein
MRVLFLHPEDVPWQGEWAQARWDLVIDLGFAGAAIYEDWSRRIGCRVVSLHHYAGSGEGYRWIARVLKGGRGHLLDRLGIDWWDVFAVLTFHELHAAYMLGALRHDLGLTTAEFAATRPHATTTLLTALTDTPVHCFQQPQSGSLHTITRLAWAVRNLRAEQIAEIIFDKWDPGYGIRRHFAKRRRRSGSEPVVLLPSAYSNVTRMALAYAEQLPHRKFLLVTTRRSGETNDLPSNVDWVSLAAYARPAAATQPEVDELMSAWPSFVSEVLEGTKELRQTRRAGIWSGLPRHIQTGLRVRDAWKSVMEQEPVCAVLCADDLNPFTRLPMLLARRMGQAAIYCSHGALDGGMLFKLPCADVHLVRGEMEKDYLLRARPLPVEQVEIGAPPLNTSAVRTNRDAGAIVYFSQPYEVLGGRGSEIYRELLPRLRDVARNTGRKLIIKLHPFESEKDRRRLVQSLLTKDQRTGVEVLRDVPIEEVIAGAWCGVGVDSSVAMECTLQGVPYFLCRWLDATGLGYADQFARFGAGVALRSAGEIESIPERVSQFRQDPNVTAGLWQTMDSERLDQVLFGAGKAYLSQCAS